MFDLAIIGQIPGNLYLTGLVKDAVDLEAFRFFRGIAVAVAYLDLSEVHLVIRDCGFRINLYADGRQLFARVFSQIQFHSPPAVGGFSRVLDGQIHGVFRRALKDQRQLHGGAVRGGRLIISKGNLGIVPDIQIGLIQVDVVLPFQVAVSYQRGAAVVRADLLVFKGQYGTVYNSLIGGAVIPVHIQFRAFALNPPLPGGQDILDIDVGPLHIAGHFAVLEVLHTVAVVEVGGKYRTVDDGFLRNIAGEAFKCGIGYPYVGTVHAGVIPGVLRRAGEVHSLALFGGPLVLGFVAIIVCSVILFPIEVAAPNGKAQDGIARVVQQAVQILGISPLAALYAVEDHFLGIQAQTDRVVCRTLHPGGVVPIVQEDGIGDAAIRFIPDPVAVSGIEYILIRNSAAVHNGIVPLDVTALVAHPF